MSNILKIGALSVLPFCSNSEFSEFQNGDTNSLGCRMDSPQIFRERRAGNLKPQILTLPRHPPVNNLNTSSLWCKAVLSQLKPKSDNASSAASPLCEDGHRSADGPVSRESSNSSNSNVAQGKKSAHTISSNLTTSTESSRNFSVELSSSEYKCVAPTDQLNRSSELFRRPPQAFQGKCDDSNGSLNRISRRNSDSSAHSNRISDLKRPVQRSTSLGSLRTSHPAKCDKTSQTVSSPRQKSGRVLDARQTDNRLKNRSDGASGQSDATGFGRQPEPVRNVRKFVRELNKRSGGNQICRSNQNPRRSDPNYVKPPGYMPLHPLHFCRPDVMQECFERPVEYRYRVNHDASKIVWGVIDHSVLPIKKT